MSSTRSRLVVAAAAATSAALLYVWMRRRRKAAGEDDGSSPLRRGDWASNRSAYDAVRMYYRWTFMPAGKQRSRSLALIASRGVHDYTDRDLYTFGVYTGESLKFWLERLAALGVTHGPMWGFDSYEGLPAEAEGKKLESNAWLPGAFSAADQFDAKCGPRGSIKVRGAVPVLQTRRGSSAWHRGVRVGGARGSRGRRGTSMPRHDPLAGGLYIDPEREYKLRLMRHQHESHRFIASASRCKQFRR